MRKSKTTYYGTGILTTQTYKIIHLWTAITIHKNHITFMRTFNSNMESDSDDTGDDHKPLYAS